MLERLEDEDTGALRRDEPVAALVERPRGALGIVVAGRQRAHRAEAADERLVDAGLGAAGEHHLGVPAPDRLPRLADRVTAGGAGGDDREVRPERAAVDRDLAGPDVGDAHRDEERADPVRAALGVDRDVVGQGADAAEARAEDDPGRLGQGAFEPLGQAGRVHRLARGDEAERDVAVRPAELLAVEDMARVEVADLAGDLRGDPRRVERGDRPDAAAPGGDAGPRARDVVAERA